MGSVNVRVAACLVLALTTIPYGQAKNRSVVLPEHVTQHLALCSRPGPPKFDSTWHPTEVDVRKMESRLSRVSRLRSQGGLDGVQIQRPSHYYRQYVGIRVGERKLIFINAFCDETPPSYWQDRLVDVCDGGCSWGVVYDTVTGEFSDLEINGIA
jgi:hypothetical protein